MSGTDIPENQIYKLCGGEVAVWIEQGSSIHLKAVAGTDPVELTEEEARELGKILHSLANKLDS